MGLGKSKSVMQLYDIESFDRYFGAEYDDDCSCFAMQLIEEKNLMFNKDKDVEYFDSHALDCYGEMKQVYVRGITDLLVENFFELYIDKKGCRKYVLLSKKGYETVTWDKYNKMKCSPGAKPLKDFRIVNHLKGKKTVCVFSLSDATKFICFDVDIKDKNNKKGKAQKVVRLLVDTLVKYGIPKDRIYTSWSGSKGYHVEIFFKHTYSLSKAELFFDLIVNRPSLKSILNANIEFLPTATRAIKLPLGLNFLSRFKKNRLCNFVDIHSGEEFIDILSLKHFMDIQKTDHEIIDTAVERLIADNASSDNSIPYGNNSTITSLTSVSSNNEMKQQKDVNSTVSQLIPEQSNNKKSLESILRLEREGLKQPGTRHDSLLSLAILYKCYYNYCREENKSKLIEWLENQDKNTYTTPLEDSIKDIEKIVQYTYDRDYQLGKNSPSICISAKEMEQVIKVKQKNAKLLLFTLLVHNKRHSFVGGIFYMSKNLMSKSSGLCDKTCRNQLKNLVNQKFVEEVETMIPDGNGSYEANRYKLLLGKHLRVIDEGNKKIEFDYNNNDNIREYYLKGLEILEDKTLKEYLSKKDYHLFKKGEYIKKLQ